VNAYPSQFLGKRRDTETSVFAILGPGAIQGVLVQYAPANDPQYNQPGAA